MLFKSTKTTDLKLKTNVAKTTRGPLKALPNANASTVPMRRLQLSSVGSVGSTSNTSMMSDEDQSLYDDYLLSALMVHNVKKNCAEGKAEANRDLWALWSAIDGIEKEVSDLQLANAEMKILTKYQKETTEENEHLRKCTDTMKAIKPDLNRLVDALEQKRHHLVVEGTKVDDNVEATMEKWLPQLDKMAADANKNMPQLEKLLEVTKKYEDCLEVCKSTGKEAEENMKTLKSKALKQASMKLSLQQIENKTSIDDMIENLVTLPPEPKLIDF